MIKNIVFDMGKVLVGYDGMRVCEHFIENEHDRKRVHTAVFVSPEWVMLDMGVLTDEQALKTICTRLPKRLHEVAATCMGEWHNYCMWTYQEMEPVIRRLKERGFGIYLCSNAAIRLLDCYQQVIPAVDCFDGLLFSADVKCIKPQKEIYGHLFGRFGLKPEECFFIDDVLVNIEGARACGMDGYCFSDGDFGKLEAVLEALEG
ncbi:HAD family phosphatase [Clostridiaceae bacterium]|nr:HAD family phosphatase [Clostridiaceae bacterium]RKI14135.1 HAD family phosphatase [bacterium 1XD21-70]